MSKKTVYIEIGNKMYPMRFSLGASKAIAERFGGLDKMTEEMSKGNSAEAIDTILWIIQLLINQGCAYKNLFESDVPADDHDPVREGKFVAITKEELEVGLELMDLAQIKTKIFETLYTGKQQEIKAELKNEKNAETT